jgi:hypothetical protein
MSESPLARADDAKHDRDLTAEIGILQDANTDLESRWWYPLRRGDVVLMATAEGEISETYLAVPDEFDYDGPESVLRCVSTVDPGGVDATFTVPFYDLWFEAEPGTLIVIRAGRIVYGRPLYGVRAGGGS